MKGFWILFFGFENHRIVKGNRQFDHQFLLDSVTATVLHLPEPVISKEELIRQYNAGTLWYELGIDPGMRTWNPTVRKNIHTGGGK